MIDETSLGWTRYTPRFTYLLFVMLFVETMLLFPFEFCMTFSFEMKFEFN
ncbi:hypothetical protein HanRHA438_Chr11g0497011 [Helianthus annuus]|nr:hypothetical protein HanRHA438_Chr11g0497011 [Helianthus annuus]